MEKLENITIETKDGERAVSINGKQLDLGNIFSMDISLEGNSIAVTTTEKKHYEW